jgi:redox-regulated HSP33 family molecular chaperone
MSDELRAGLYAFDLVQKRAKRPAGAPDKGLARAVTKVGIVGAGLMASQLALLFIQRLQVPVVLTDIDDERVAKGVGYVHAELDKLAGKGALAITIEPRLGGKTYQGIVELSPDGIGASAETYFAQSEQLPTVIRLAAAPLYVAGDPAPRWRAGGLMLQMTPESAKLGQEIRSDDWDRLSLLLKTVEDLELVDTSLKPETLLWRLFHEDEVRVAPPERVTFRCDCDTARITQILKRYTPQEREGLADPDGVIRARCEFCGKSHEVGPESLA